jgi:colanic acid biosynthesis glycosyl transferase WcaI
VEKILMPAVNKPTRILFLSQWFDPEPGAKGLVFARKLVSMGFEVEVITGFPNYPGGRLYPGYKVKLLQRETIDGVEVTRVPLYPSHNQSAFHRVLNYASFAASALVYGLFMAKRADVMYAYHPPLTVGVVASLIRWVRGIPLVYDVQDMWPDTLRATGMLNNPLALAVVRLVCDWVYNRVDQIVVLSSGFKRLMVQRGVPEDDIEVIYNWADESTLTSPKGEMPAAFPPTNRFKVLFAGNMGKAQGLDAVLNAAAILQARGSRASLVMLGGGVEVSRLKALALEMKLGNVVFLPPVPMSLVGKALVAADVLLVHLRKDPLFEITIPSKTQAYMAVGKPLLMAVNGDAADLVRQAKCGLTVDSEDPQALADAVDTFAAMSADELKTIGQSASRFYESALSLEVGVAKFAKVFESVIEKVRAVSQ